MRNQKTSRRTWMHHLTQIGVVACGSRTALPASCGTGCQPVKAAASSGAAEPCRMKLALSPGSIGVKVGMRECINLAHQYGFQAVEPNSAFLAELGKTELEELLAEMKAKRLQFSIAGLPVDFRGDEAKFRGQLEGLPRLAAALQAAGVERVGTWISPGHNELTYLQNFRQHVNRLRQVATVLQAHGLRFGLEYVGTPSSRQGRRFPFLHSMRETQELIAEIGTGQIGYILDSWHWWTAGEAAADIAALKPADVVSVDLNDAPAGLSLEQQQDGQRELPCATGVIPIGDFLGALKRLGYDGPVRAEPFNKALNDLDNDAACSAAIAALRQAMKLADC